MQTIWSVVSSNPIMLFVLVALLVGKYLGPRLRKMWRGGL